MNNNERCSITLAASVLAAYPEVQVSAFRAAHLDRLANLSLDRLTADAVAQLESAGITVATLAQDPRINAWRGAAKSAGLKPSSFKSSAEQLGRRVLLGDFSTPLVLVTAYCLVSARYLAPLGAYDVTRLPERVIELRHGRPQTDHFDPLGGRSADMPITDRVVVYAVGDTVACWSWNHRDSRTTCLTPETTDAIFIGESVDASQHSSRRSAMEQLAQVLELAGATIGPIVTADVSQQSAHV